MPYVEKRIRSGDLLEVERYFVTRITNSMSRGPITSESSQGQQTLNNRRAQKMLVRLINANFDGRRGDLFLTLTYAEDVDEETARREIKNFFARVRYLRRKMGLTDLKYIVITEKQGKWHHHVIMNALPMDTVMDIWGHGRVSVSRLDKTYNYRDLANYLLREDKSQQQTIKDAIDKQQRRKHARRWNSSKNLTQPVYEPVKVIRRESDMKKEPRPDKGYILLPDWKSGCDMNGNLYQYFTCVRIEKPQAQKGKAKNGSRKR